MGYFAKMRGTTKSPPIANFTEIFCSWVGSLLGIGVLSYLDFKVAGQYEAILLIAPFGASAVLVFGAPKSPMAQPRNVIFGHVIAALVGVSCYKLFHFEPWSACAPAVSTAIVLMHLTKTLHPPAGATALIAILGGKQIHALGFSFALMPVALGAAMLICIGVIFNNIPSTRRYPEFWL